MKKLSVLLLIAIFAVAIFACKGDDFDVDGNFQTLWGQIQFDSIIPEGATRLDFRTVEQIEGVDRLESISWVTSSPAVVSNTGAITTPLFDTVIVITATATIDGDTRSNQWLGTRITGQGGQQIFEGIFANLLSQIPVTIRRNFVLPATVTHDTPQPVTVTWTSSNSEAIALSGLNATVTTAEANQTSVLTATATMGAYTRTREFTVTVGRTLSDFANVAWELDLGRNDNTFRESQGIAGSPHEDAVPIHVWDSASAQLVPMTRRMTSVIRGGFDNGGLQLWGLQAFVRPAAVEQAILPTSTTQFQTENLSRVFFNLRAWGGDMANMERVENIHVQTSTDGSTWTSVGLAWSDSRTAVSGGAQNPGWTGNPSTLPYGIAQRPDGRAEPVGEQTVGDIIANYTMEFDIQLAEPVVGPVYFRIAFERRSTGTAPAQIRLSVGSLILWGDALDPFGPQRSAAQAFAQGISGTPEEALAAFPTFANMFSIPAIPSAVNSALLFTAIHEGLTANWAASLATIVAGEATPLAMENFAEYVTYAIELFATAAEINVQVNGLTVGEGANEVLADGIWQPQITEAQEALTDFLNTTSNVAPIAGIITAADLPSLVEGLQAIIDRAQAIHNELDPLIVANVFANILLTEMTSGTLDGMVTALLNLINSALIAELVDVPNAQVFRDARIGLQHVMTRNMRNALEETANATFATIADEEATAEEIRAFIAAIVPYVVIPQGLTHAITFLNATGATGAQANFTGGARNDVTGATFNFTGVFAGRTSFNTATDPFRNSPRWEGSGNPPGTWPNNVFQIRTGSGINSSFTAEVTSILATAERVPALSRIELQFAVVDTAANRDGVGYNWGIGTIPASQPFAGTAGANWANTGQLVLEVSTDGTTWTQVYDMRAAMETSMTNDGVFTPHSNVISISANVPGGEDVFVRVRSVNALNPWVHGNPNNAAATNPPSTTIAFGWFNFFA